MQQGTPQIAVWIPLLVVLPLIYWRMRRAAKSRPLKLGALWFRPIILAALTAMVLFGTPPAASDWTWLVLAAVLGAVLGWYWGRMVTIEVHPENGTLMTKRSQAAMIVFFALIVMRVGLRAGLQMEADVLHITPVFIADIFIVFAAALFGVQALEMYLRARRVMGENAPVA
jgi:membrane protein CcdC involved in cytochrome C biogenesis